MIKLGTLFWEMAVENSDFLAGLKLADDAVDTFAGNTESGLGKAAGAFAKIGLGAAALVKEAAGQLVQFGKEAITLASAAEEAGSKFDTVFGPAARAVEEDLAGFAQEAQRSRYELKEMASSVQDTFVPLGFAREEAAELSKQLVKLAVDVGSFNNVADSDVMASFQSALVGNHEAVRRFGIIISEATMSQELYNMGIEGGVRAATELEKTQARLNLLMKGSSDAQGDAMRTADSWANQMRGLEATLRDVKTAIGEELLPQVTPFVETLGDFAEHVAPLVVAAIGSIVEAVEPAVQKLSELLSNFESAMAAASTEAERSLAQMGEASRTGAEIHTGFVRNSVQQLNLLVDAVKMAWQTVGEAFTGFAAGWGSFWDLLGRGDVEGAINAMSAAMREVGDESVRWLNTVANNLPEVVELMNATGMDINEAIDAIGLGFSELDIQTMEFWSGWGGQMDAWVTDTQEGTTQIAAATDETAEAFESMVDRIMGAMEGEKTFGPMAEEIAGYYQTLAERSLEYQQILYDAEVGYAQARTEIQLQLQQDLAAVDAEYANVRAGLVADGESAQLAIIDESYARKRAGILAQANKELEIQSKGYKAQIANAGTKEKEILRILEIGAKTTAGIVGTMSREQAMAAIVSYGDMAAAATGWAAASVAAAQRVEQALLQGKYDDPTAAIAAIYNAAVQSMQGQAAAAAQAAGAAIDSITADFQSGIDASLDLAGALGDVDTALGEIGSTGRPGGSGGGVRPQVVDPLEEAADIVEKLGKMIETAVEAFDTLTDWGGPAEGWQEVFDLLLDALSEMVTKYAEVVDEIKDSGILEPEAYDVLIKATTLIDKVMGLFARTVDTVQALDVEELPEIAGQVIVLAAAMVDLTLRLQGVVDSLSAEVEDLDMERLAEIAEQIAAAMAPWAAAAQTMVIIAETAQLRVGPAAERLFLQIQNLIWKLRRFDDLVDEELLTQVAELADRIVAALKPYEVASKTMEAIIEGTALRVGPAAETLFLQMQNLIWKLRRFTELVPEELLDEVAELAPKIVAALSPYAAAASAVTAIARATSRPIGDAAERLFLQMQNLIWKLRRFDDLVDDDLLTQVAELAPKIISALAPYEAAAGTVYAIVQASSRPVGDKAEDLLETMVSLATMLADAAAEPEMTERLVKAAQVARLFEDALRPWERAIRLADEMRAWRAMPELEERFIEFGQQWIVIVGALGDAALALSNEGLAAAGQFASVLESLMTGLEQALTLALEMPADWAEPDWQPFVTWVQDIFMTFYSWINQWGSSEPGGPVIPIFDDEGLDIVGQFAGVLGSLMGALNSALALALALPADWVDPDWQPFVMWVQDVFMAFWDWIMTWGSSEPGGPVVPRFGDEELNIIAAFGGALGAVFDGLKSALEFALLLPEEWTEPASWDPFITWVLDAFGVVAAWVEDYLPEDPEEASIFEPVAEFGGALGAVFDGLKSALELALLLPEEWTEPASWDPFITWVLDAFGEVVAWVEDYLPEDPEEASVFEPVEAFGNALGAVFDGLSAALAFALGLPDSWDPPSQETWDAFIGWVEAVMAAVIVWVEDYLPQDPEEASVFEPVEAFGNALGAVFGGLTSALELFVGLQQWVGPGSTFQDRLDAFLGLVLQAFQDISDYVELNLTAEQMTAVAEFGAALSSLTSGLSSGLSLFAALADTDPTVYTESNLFEDRVGHLLAAISGVLAAFQAWIIANSDAEWLDPAQEFFDAVNLVFGLLRDGLQLFADLEATGMPPSSLIQAFISTLLGVFGTFATSLAAMAADGGQIDGAVTAIETLLSAFPTSLATTYTAWHDAGGDLGGAAAQGLLDSVGAVGDPGSAGTIWGAIGHISWTLDQWEPGQTMLDSYYQHGVDLAGSLVAGMLSQVDEMFDAGEALAQAGLDGFAAGGGLGEAMAHAMASAAPEWLTPDVGANLTVNYVHTIHFEGAMGAANGLDLSPRSVQAIARALGEHVRRGG